MLLGDFNAVMSQDERLSKVSIYQKEIVLIVIQETI